MITIETQVPVFVGTPNGERALTDAGQWQFPAVNYVSLGTTNEPAWFTNLSDGTVISVDAGGLVDVTPGPEVGYWAINGFTVAIMSLGIMMGIRWVFRRVSAAAEISGRAFD